MNFLKTISSKYDLPVNSQKLSKKSLTEWKIYDIIDLGEARDLPHFFVLGCIEIYTHWRDDILALAR